MAAIGLHAVSIALLIITSMQVAPCLSRSSPQKMDIGFSAPLIHRDSPRSPLYNPNSTPRDRALSAFRRTMVRGQRVSLDSVYSNITEDEGDYLMSFWIGTPPVLVYALIDTGSELIWIQCLPCDNCYEQSSPIFDPSKSTSFQKIKCQDPSCKIFDRATCPDNFCGYSESYADGSYTIGEIAHETFTFHDDSSTGESLFSSSVFGCGHNNSGIFSSKIVGIVGLSRLPLSLPKQILAEKFSYCLLPLGYDPDNDAGNIFFGSKAIIGDTKTPFAKVKNMELYYHLNLNGISVDETPLNIPNGTFTVTAEGDGGFIIDSGAVYTRLPESVFSLLTKELAYRMELDFYEDPGSFKFCYLGPWEDLEVTPPVTFHFQDADFQVPKSNLWVESGPDVWCLGMIASDTHSSLGSYQLQNHNVGYDLQNQLLSIDYMDCASQ